MKEENTGKMSYEVLDEQYSSENVRLVRNIQVEITHWRSSMSDRNESALNPPTLLTQLLNHV